MGSAPVSIRRYLMLIVLSALLPMGLFAAGLLYYLWEYQQTQRNQEQLARVRALASLVEGEIQSSIARLRLLASDPQLDEASSSSAFHQRLSLLLRQSDDWANLVLLSPERQLLNASVPYGTPLPDSVQQTYQKEAFANGRPVTSDLFTARVRGVRTLAVAVPVFRGGEVAYVLVAGLRLSHLSKLLTTVVPADGVAGLFDRSLRFVARSRDPEPYIGRPSGDLLQAAMREHTEGVIRSETREGESTFTAFIKLANGWYMGVATPSAPLDRAFAKFLALLGGGWLATLLLGLFLTRILMQRINSNVAATVKAAAQLAAGSPAAFPRFAVAELVAISDAIQSLFRRERQARSQCEAANKTKDEFLAMLGHELRNPLAPISTALQLMRARGSDVFMKERAIIERQVLHMVRLVDDLLDVARIARGGVELKKTTLEFAVVVAEALEISEPLLKRKRLVVSVAVPPHGLKVSGDSARLVQVLSNLLNNAAKFTSVEDTISIAATARSGRMELSVADNGAGMDATELTRVFELFTQGKQSVDRPRGGLGLGLAIARSMARLHGGDVVGRSGGRRRGSTFTLTLPLVTEAGPTATSPEPVSAAGGEHSVGAGRLVLVVDDNVDAAIGLAELLRLWDFRTHVIHDGREVLEVLRQVSPDAVLLDIGLPGMDGFEVAALIRREPQWRQLRLIALTGYGQASDRERSREVGFDVHLVKPVDPVDLVAALQATLSGAGAQAGLS